jgi:serine/threonine protein kinase
VAADVDAEHVFTADAAGPDPLIGVIVDGKYELKRLLGRGGMGAVYEAEHRMIGKRVAVKVLHKEFCSNAEIVKRFVREARSATAIGHPNIVEVFDMGTMEGGGFFQVIELLEGSSLQDVVDEGPMSYARAVAILSQVADALVAVHDKGIVHRDLKPDNVFLVNRPGNSDFVKLLDFGVAKVIDANSGMQTRTGMIIGTPAYMSPEQARGASDVDLQTDVFALGVMAFELLTGQRPFDADTFPQILLKICVAETPSLSAYRTDVPDGFQVVLERLLAKERSSRFPDCRSVRQSLAPFASLGEPPRLTEVQPGRQPLSNAEMRKAGDLTDPFAATGVSAVDAEVSTDEPRVRPVVEAQRSTPGTADLAPGRSSTGRFVAAAAALLLSALGTFAYFRGDSNEVVAPPIMVTGATSQVRIQLHADPPAAALFLDDAPVENPYDAELPASTAPHIVEARLAGYRTARRAVAFEAPVNLTLALVRDPTSETAVAAEAVTEDAPELPEARPAGRRSRRRAEEEATPPTPMEPVTTPVAPTPVAPTPAEEPPRRPAKNVQF